MMRVDEIVQAIDALRRSDIDAWLGEQLISAQEGEGELVFSAMECARIRLICTLRYELEIDPESLPVVLSLVDQLYQTRQRLLSLAAAVAAQDEAVQAAVLAALGRGSDSGE
jgi:chaperone modulatory protein CbpM